ncbi:truncated FRIGIDA-like protein 1 [Andrographis paniculata]|uniref:truncated FRIGIDA-like protein 1 n=1 Tax=Andrographis paniculata TaxID=175694 RepID=UPI0021E7BD61|nr:truncated FRIGIDA-like protein 1 [Andrographis paniculata]
MALTSVKSIEKAFNLVDTKKENLKKAFEELQAHSSSLSSFNFTWNDLDSYFTSVTSELLQKFSILQALASSSADNPKPGKQRDSLPLESPAARPELKALCENMDGLGLRDYVIDRPKERAAIRSELADAFKHAPDPGSMVLDALDGFWDVKNAVLSRSQTACVALMEELMRSGVEINALARDRAMAMVMAWKGRMGPQQSGNGGNGDDEVKEGAGLERLGYLQLLATYRLFVDGRFDVNELIDCVVLSARYRQTVDLCRILGLEEKVSDIIQRLISNSQQLIALKFVFEFGLTDKYPPVPLLKAFVMESCKSAHAVRKAGKSSRQSLNDAAMKEISALKSAIKCIEDHGLEHEYPKNELVARVVALEKEKADRKRSAQAPIPKPPQQQAKQPKKNSNKRMKPSAVASAFKRKHPSNLAVLPPQPPSMNRAGLLPDHAAPYINSSAGAYVMAAPPLMNSAPYVGSSADLYGLPGSAPPVAYPGNLNPAAPNHYPSEAHAQPGYYDRAAGYGGYDYSAQYHHAFYPQ